SSSNDHSLTDGAENSFMAKCSKCGASVPEQKAFCPECGAPMSAQAAERKQSAADLGATVIVPPSQWSSAPMPTPTPPAATPAPPVTDAPRGSGVTVWLLVGTIVLLVIIIAFVLLRR